MLQLTCGSCGSQIPRRPTAFGCAFLNTRKLARRASTGRHSARRCKQQYRAHTICAAQAAIKDPYKVLGLQSNADTAAIKKAFKQKAKALHPDVNKAADAADRFMECKMAYQLLTDPQKRQQYDRQSQAGFDWGDFVDGIANGGTPKQRQKDSEEPFYGFTDFLRDLDGDLKKWSDQVNQKGFKSLLDELYDAGLIAVGALEKQLGIRYDSSRPSPSGQSDQSAASPPQSSQPEEAARGTPDPPRDSPQDESEVIRRRVQAFEAEAERKKKQAEQEVDDMLADLKADLNKRLK